MFYMCVMSQKQNQMFKKNLQEVIKVVNDVNSASSPLHSKCILVIIPVSKNR